MIEPNVDTRLQIFQAGFAYVIVVWPVTPWIVIRWVQFKHETNRVTMQMEVTCFSETS